MRRRMLLEGGLPAQPYQIFDYATIPASTEKSGVTWINNNDGTFTMSGTNTSTSSIYVQSSTATIGGINGHAILLYGSPPTPTTHTWYLFMSDVDVAGVRDNNNGYAIQIWGSNKVRLRMYCGSGYTASNVVFTPQLIDLTATYGAGNEPTTLAEFKADYPLDYYPYNPPTA